MQGSFFDGVEAGPVIRFKNQATGRKFYFGTVVVGMPVKQRRLRRVFRRASEAERYARVVARRLPFWRMSEGVETA